MARKFFYFSVMFACVMVSCARIDDTISSSQNDQPQIEDTENSTDEDGEIVDPYPHVELTDTLRIECQGDNKEEEKKESAETEGEDDTKTYLNAQNHIYWKKGDRIKIYYADGGTNYTVSEIKHGDQQTSTFDALVDKNASYYYAFYPENIEAVMTDIAGNGAFEVVIPTTQDGKFENCHLAIGKSSAEDRSFSFKNIASYMKIVVDDLTATSLTLSARDENNAIVGTLVAPFADEAGNLGSLSLKNGTGSSSVTVNLASGRKAPCTIYVALLPGVNFSQGFRLRYNYDAQSGPGFAYTSNRSIERKKILNVGTLSNRIHTDWFVKTDGTISDPSQGGNSWENALNTAGLVALLNQPTVDGVQDNALAYDKACVLDGATIHIAQGNYTLSELKLSATGYDNLVKVRILGSYPTGLTGTNTSATRDVEDNRTTFAGNGSSRILLVEDKVDLALDKLWFTGGRSAVDKTHEGGTALSARSTAIDQASNLSLSHCGFEDNVASGLNADGGAVYLSRATAYMENCEFKNNSCGEGQIGGAINLFDEDYHTTLTLKSCQFSGNKAGLSGGAVSCSKGKLYIFGTEESPTVFEENCVTTSGVSTRGGALLLAYASSVEVEYTNFIGNYGIATGEKGTEGGAVAFDEASYGSFEHVSFVGTKGAKNAVRNGAHVSAGNSSDPVQSTTFKNCSFTNGQAYNVAGAVNIHKYSKLSFENCDFCANLSGTYGGVIHINSQHASADFTSCNFGNASAVEDNCNQTGSMGGALSMEDGTVTLTKCNFYGNKTTSTTSGIGGGAIALHYMSGTTKKDPSVILSGCTIMDSKALISSTDYSRGGGAISVATGSVTIQSHNGEATTISRCTASSASGGAILAVPSAGRTVSLNLTGANFSENAAQYSGGAVHFASPDLNSELVCTDCTFTSNQQADNTNGISCRGGGAIYTTGGKMQLLGCEFNSNSSNTTYAGNDANSGGGALQIISIDANGDSMSDYPCEVTIGKSNSRRTRFVQNFSKTYGGAISFTNNHANTAIDIDYTDFVNNESDKYGGGLYWHADSDLILESVRFDNNRTGVKGDAIAFDGVNLTMTSAQAVDSTNINKCDNYIINHTPNDEDSDHTVIHVPNVTNYVFTNFVFKNNTVNGNGALICKNSKKIKFAITGSWLEGNVGKAGNGGLIYVDNLPSDADASTIQSTLIKHNEASGTESLGGAIYYNCDSWSNQNPSIPTLKITTKSSLIGNKAGKAGSAIYLNKGYVQLNNATLSYNTFHTLTSTENDAGGVISIGSNFSKVDCYNSTLCNNVSTGKGGVFNYHGGRVFVNKCQMDNNSAESRGGVFFLSNEEGVNGFFMVQRSSFVGNYVRRSGDRWGNFVHANNAQDRTHFMCANSTIVDGDNAPNSALINGSVNLLLYGCTLLANNNNGAIRLENGRSGILLNNLILNKKTDKPSILINETGGYTFSSKGGYNVVGTVSDLHGSSWVTCTGNQVNKTTANLGSWNATLQGSGFARYFTWDGKVGGTAVSTPLMDIAKKTDYLSIGLLEGFAISYKVTDGLNLNATVDNLGYSYVNTWGDSSYYKDIKETERTYNGHYPGAYTVKK